MKIFNPNNNGYLLISRRLIENPVFKPVNENLKIFLFCLCNADYNTGQLDVSIRLLANRFERSKSYIYECLGALKTAGLIQTEKQPENKPGQISILNYHLFKESKGNFILVPRELLNKEILFFENYFIYLLLFYHSICEPYTKVVSESIENVSFMTGIKKSKILTGHLTGHKRYFTGHLTGHLTGHKKKPLTLYELSKIEVLKNEVNHFIKSEENLTISKNDTKSENIHYIRNIRKEKYTDTKEANFSVCENFQNLFTKYNVNDFTEKEKSTRMDLMFQKMKNSKQVTQIASDYHLEESTIIQYLESFTRKRFLTDDAHRSIYDYWNLFKYHLKNNSL